ncbi:MAG: thioredoxin fold domain-containing protein [Leptolyngbya sp. SIO1D8]|nr:thioredoxin fold domain-containing protein [Leptolyngbya sp. SIO1D8]
MTANQLSNNPGKTKLNLIAIAVVVLFAIAAFWLTQPDTASKSFSPLSGLMTLKATAQEAIPYSLAMADPKPTLVEFYADWCTTCQALAPTLQSVHHQFGEQINFVMLDIDDPQWQAQVQQFQVSGVPHLVLLNSDQTLVDTFIGKVPKQVIANRVAELLG